MGRYVDLDERVTAQFYSEECEEWTMQTCTIADVLDSVCDEYTVLQSAQPEIVKTILEAGYTGQEVRFRIGGRLFAVRELAQ